MNLRHKLIGLHTAFAFFAVAAASATIYGVNLHARNAIRSFERLIDQSSVFESLRVDARAQGVAMREIVEGRRDLNAAYLAGRDAFFTQLEEVANFAGQGQRDGSRLGVGELGQRFQAALDQCGTLVQAMRPDEARTILNERIERDLLVALDARMRAIRREMDEARRLSVNRVLTANTRLLGLAGLIGVGCAGLIFAGTALLRRWFLVPVRHLEHAAGQFARGNLSHRVQVESRDELASLGRTLNDMARSLAESELKYRSLFENLRDAVIICDSAGTIIECHDGDTRILGLGDRKIIGRRLLEAWSEWASADWDWGLAVARVVASGERLRTEDVRLSVGTDRQAVADVLIYPVQYAGTRHAAVVLRDVTERHRLQQLVRRAETIEAAVTFARGIAHDFKNVLHSAVTTLSLLEQSSNGGKSAERIQKAMRACRQAASLSRRLVAFAGTDEGNPERLDLGETVQLILSSLDEPFLESVRLDVGCACPVEVHLDRDHFTQIVLNLLYNAREAMPAGGTLRIAVESVVAANPIGHQRPTRFALLVVADTGCGMAREVRDRVFEPLFTTKVRGPDGVRGLGLATVYAIVTRAGGFIQLDSEVGAGSTFRVFLPCDAPRAGPD